MKKSAHPRLLTLVEPGLSAPQPSRPLGEHGQALWRRVTTEYAIDDAAGVEMLTQCCQAVDLAEAPHYQRHLAATGQRRGALD